MFARIKNGFTKGKMKALLLVSSIFCMSIPLFADEVSAPDVGSQIDSVTATITRSFDISIIVKVIGAILGSGLSFWIVWWAVRKIVRGVKNAFAGRDINV